MDLTELLAASAASDAFREDVRVFAERGSAPSITTARYAPRVKVLRVLAQLLYEEPASPIERVHVDALSGCADYRGSIDVHAAGLVRSFDFEWDCHWRARQEGWTDFFGFPDQIRAAREFGWRCFKEWRERPSAAEAQPAGSAAELEERAQTAPS